MPRKKDRCACGNMKLVVASQCRECRNRSPYRRTPEHRAEMSRTRTGQPKPPGYVPASKRPEVAAKIAAYWTPEVRAAKALAVSNPSARYHGLSSRKAAAIVRQAGACHRCDHDGSESRLGIHHRDRNKHNQAPGNLEVLCHRCHMQEHSDHHEVGWSRHHATRA